MKHYLLHYRFKLVVVSMVVSFLTGTVYSQNLSSLIDAIHDVESKLTKLINDESSARKTADEKLRAAIAGSGKSSSVTLIKADTTLKNDVLALGRNVDTLEAGQLDIKSKIEKVAEQLEHIQNAKSDGKSDEEIKNLAKSLMSLIGELKQVVATINSEPQKESVEIGGVVTVDGGIDPQNVKGGSAEIGKVSLSANVYLTPEITASITLKAGGDLGDLGIDKALVEWKPEGKTFNMVFGQHTLNHGLLSTHLISDPFIVDNVETALPGISGQFERGAITMGAGVGFSHVDAVVEDSLYLSGSSIVSEEVIRKAATNLFAGTINIDATFLKESQARLSLRIMGDELDIALGTGIVKGALSIDAEGFAEAVGKEGAQPAGYYIGLAYAFNDAVEGAVRYDGLSADLFADLDHRIGAGVTVGLIQDIFIAAEYGYTKDASGASSSEIALQLGIESSIKLPGFQRKTLTQD